MGSNGSNSVKVNGRISRYNKENIELPKLHTVFTASEIQN